MTCRELIDFLIDYVDGLLAAEERRPFEEHLAICPECRAYLDSYKTTLSLEKLCQEHDDIPHEIPEDLVQAVLTARRQATTDG